MLRGAGRRDDGNASSARHRRPRRSRPMTALVAIETVVVVLLVIAVTGLLRSHGEVLRQLHALGAGLDPNVGANDGPTVLRPRGDRSGSGSALATAADLAGAGLYDDAVSIPVLGV